MPKRKHHLTRRRNHSTIESMAEEVKSIIVYPKHTPPKLVLVIVGILIAIAGIVFGLNYYQKGGQVSPPARVVIPHQLDTCSVTKEGNPLVESLSTQPDLVEGNFKGKITDLEFDKVLNSYLIKLTSLDDSQSYKFLVRDGKGVFFTNSGETSGPALRTNQVAQLTFVCDKKSNGFKITKVLIL